VSRTLKARVRGCEHCALMYVYIRMHQHTCAFIHFLCVYTCLSKARVDLEMRNVCPYECEYMCVQNVRPYVVNICVCKMCALML